MTITFSILSVFLFLLICSSLAAILSNNPVLSVLSLVLVFIFTSFIFFWLGSDFLAILIIIIYVGAIATLFLFVVMMFDLRATELHNKFFYFLRIAFFLGFFSLLQFYFIVVKDVLIFTQNSLYYNTNVYNIYWIDLIDNTFNVNMFGQLLYNYYGFYVIFVGLILLVAMMGCVMLTQDLDYRPKKKLNTDVSEFYKKTTEKKIFISFWDKGK